MKPLLTFCFCLSLLSAGAQFSRSYYFNGKTVQASGAYAEYDAINDCYFTASGRKYTSGNGETVISRLDATGNTTWHTRIPHSSLSITYEFALSDLLLSGNHVFVSVYHCPSPATATLKIYKLDALGALLDSAVIDPPGGMERVMSGMAVDDQGIIFTGCQDDAGNIFFCKVDPVTMDIIHQQGVATTSTTNPNASRGIFAEFDGTHSIIAFNTPGDIQVLKFDNAAALSASFAVINPDGELTDFEYDGFGYFMLINKHFTTSTATDNPLRIIRAMPSGAVLTDDVYTVQHPVIFENLAVDDNQDVYIVGRGQAGSVKTGSLIKVTTSGMAYEQPMLRSHLHEIEIAGDYLYLSGNYKDAVTDCSYDAHGSVLMRHKKTDAPVFNVVGPHMEFSFNNISTVMAYNSHDLGDPLNYYLNNYTVAGAGNTVYNSALLVGGVDINGTLRCTSDILGNSFAAGPLTNPGDYTVLERDKWERNWIVSREQIDAHIAAFQAGDPTYKIPEAIKNWPGNGETAKGQHHLITRFMDLNGNTLYEPQLGEYPLIIGDYCVLSVYNDYNSDFMEDCYSDPMHIEVHEYAYGFNCGNDSTLQNTLYFHYEIINLSGSTLYNTYVGGYMDTDINYPTDDYVSSDPMRGAFYGRDGLSSGQPMQAYVILGSKTDLDATDNAAGIGANESPNGIGYGNGIPDDERLGMTSFLYFNNSSSMNGQPTQPQDIHFYLQSIWKNGQHVQFGGNGYNTGTIPLDATFMFPGDADPLHWTTGGTDPGFTWTEEAAGNPPADRRGMAGSGPFTFSGSDTVFYDIAYVTGMENTTAGYTSYEAMIANIDSARSYYVANAAPCGQNYSFYAPFNGFYPYLGTEENRIVQPVLFPNPSNGSFTIQGIAPNTSIRIFNVSGQLIHAATSLASSMDVDCTHLPKGVYFVQLQGEAYSGTLKCVIE